jgi:hypothetical protein
MTIVLRLIQWSNSAPFKEVQIDLSNDRRSVTIGHPPPGATRTSSQCWLKFDVVEFDHALVWRHGGVVRLAMIANLTASNWMLRTTIDLTDLHSERGRTSFCQRCRGAGSHSPPK